MDQGGGNKKKVYILNHAIYKCQSNMMHRGEKGSNFWQCMIRGIFLFHLYQSIFRNREYIRTYFYWHSWIIADPFSIQTTTGQKISWNGWADLQVTDIIVVVFIYNSRQGGLTCVYEQRDATRSVFILLLLSYVVLDEADSRHEWYKLNHWVYLRERPFTFIMS